MPKTCICYTTDQGYLLPTYVSAMQARLHTPADIADIIILGIGVSAALERTFLRACTRENIIFLSIPPHRLEGADAMLARLFLDRLLPQDYDQILYVDGDTQIFGDLTPLLRAEVPEGRFLAACDPMSFSLRCGDRSTRELAKYFAQIGLSEGKERDYFNSGVLRINRAGWDMIGSQAWEMFKILRGGSRYPDQDALNIVAMDRCIPMSLSWNFPIFLRNARVDHIIAPRIVHYMGSPKPWHGRFLPWRAEEHETYLSAVRRHAELAPYLTQMPWPRQLKYNMQQRYKQLTEGMVWGRGQRRQEILNYERHVGSLSPRPAVTTELVA